jgi:hypothetical protein
MSNIYVLRKLVLSCGRNSFYIKLKALKSEATVYKLLTLISLLSEPRNKNAFLMKTTNA